MANERDIAEASDSSIVLSANAEATHRELLRLDIQLADLFMFGYRLARVRGAAVPYMLAHAGRELSRGVINILSGTIDPLSQSVDEPAEPQSALPQEKNRARIALALELTEGHSTVKQWFECVDVFSRSAHFSARGKNIEKVRRAFERFSELLYARLAPFFEPAAELSRLSQLQDPSAADADFVTSLLARPQLRRQFFASTDSANWLPLLAEKGHFDHPPDREVLEDGSWRMVAWPEGEYLARIASREPAKVTAQLLLVPLSNTNPVVWAVLVDSALALDEPYAGQLAKRVQAALQSTPPQYLAHRVIALVTHMTRRNDRIALSLFRTLLEMRADEARQVQLDRLAPLGEFASLSTGSTDWTLRRLDAYEVRQLFEQALPTLAETSASDTFKALAKSLDRCLRLLREKDETDGDWPYSHIWLPRIGTCQ